MPARCHPRTLFRDVQRRCLSQPGRRRRLVVGLPTATAAARRPWTVSTARWSTPAARRVCGARSRGVHPGRGCGSDRPSWRAATPARSRTRSGKACTRSSPTRSEPGGRMSPRTEAAAASTAPAMPGRRGSRLRSGTYLREIAVDPVDSQILYAGGSRAFKSEAARPPAPRASCAARTAARAWTALDGLAWPFAARIAIDPSNHNRLILGSPGTGFLARTLPGATTGVEGPSAGGAQLAVGRVPQSLAGPGELHAAPRAPGTRGLERLRPAGAGAVAGRPRLRRRDRHAGVVIPAARAGGRSGGGIYLARFEVEGAARSPASSLSCGDGRDRAAKDGGEGGILNPRGGISAYTISNRAPSTARTSLRKGEPLYRAHPLARQVAVTARRSASPSPSGPPAVSRRK